MLAVCLTLGNHWIAWPGFSAQCRRQRILTGSYLTPLRSKIFLPQVHSFHSHEIGVSHSSAYNFTFIQSSPVCTQTFHPDAGSDARIKRHFYKIYRDYLNVIYLGPCGPLEEFSEQCLQLSGHHAFMMQPCPFNKKIQVTEPE